MRQPKKLRIQVEYDDGTLQYYDMAGYVEFDFKMEYPLFVWESSPVMIAPTKPTTFNFKGSVRIRDYTDRMNVTVAHRVALTRRYEESMMHFAARQNEHNRGWPCLEDQGVERGVRVPPVVGE